jgi:phage shock protein E
MPLTIRTPRALALAILLTGLTVAVPVAAQTRGAPVESSRRQPVNPLIDDAGFMRDVRASQQLRVARRVSEAEFIRMAKEPGTVVLDARSERFYAMRHVAGAVNLSFTEFTQEALARVIPTRHTRVLIYCNNNFIGAPESLATKAPAAALNLSTYASLVSYGYRNVYELGPAIDVARSKLEFAGSEVSGLRTSR